MAQSPFNGTTQPVEEGLRITMNGQWLENIPDTFRGHLITNRINRCVCILLFQRAEEIIHDTNAAVFYSWFVSDTNNDTSFLSLIALYSNESGVSYPVPRCSSLLSYLDCCRVFAGIGLLGPWLNVSQGTSLGDSQLVPMCPWKKVTLWEGLLCLKGYWRFIWILIERSVSDGISGKCLYGVCGFEWSKAAEFTNYRGGHWGMIGQL